MPSPKAPKIKTPSQMKMEMAVDRARGVLPKAERDANLGKFLEESAIKDRLYHVTGADFNEFLTHPDLEMGAHFGTPPQTHSLYDQRTKHDTQWTGANTMPVHLQLKNPYEAMEDIGAWSDVNQWKNYLRNWEMNDQGVLGLTEKQIDSLKTPTDVRNLLQKKGYDGIQYPNHIEGISPDSHMTGEYDSSYIAFEPSQIKSAIGNQGTYNPADPDITKAHGGAVHMKDGGDPDEIVDQAVMDQIRLELANQPTLKPTTDVNEQIANARRMADPARLSLDAGDAITSPEMYEKNKDLFSLNRKPSSQAYTEFGVPMVDASGKPVAAPKTVYDLDMADVEKQLNAGIKPKWMSGEDFLKYQAERKGYVTDPKTLADMGQNALAALTNSTFLGGTLRALGAVDEAAQKVTGSSYGLDPTMGIIGKTGELHRIPRGLSTLKQGVVRDVGQFSNDVFNAQRGITPGYPTLGSEFSRAFVTPKPTTYEILSGLEPSQLPSSAAKIFAGSKSKTADLAMRDIAEARLNAGEDPAKVWSETGWARPPYSGDLRYEISDTGLSADKLKGNVERKSIDYYDKFFSLRDAYKIRFGMDSGKTLDEAIQATRNFYGDEVSPKAIEIATNPDMSLSDIGSEYRKIGNKTRAQYLKTTGKLGKQIEHPEFFAAYPDLADLIKFETMSSKTVGGEFNPHNKKFKISLDTIRLGDPESLAAHELQHAVQHREGTAPGGSPAGVKASPSMFDPITASKLQILRDRVANDTGRLGELHRKAEAANITSAERKELVGLTQALPEFSEYRQAGQKFLSQGTPKELYRRLAGEAEARLTQHRLGLTPEERLAQYPYDPAYFKRATGYSVDDIINNIVRPNSSISSASEMSVPQMKAELRERVLAPANPQGFYSATEAAALNLQRKSGSGQAFLNDLLKQENVRPDEISAMGLDTWLKGKKDVTAAEVQDYIAKNKIQLGESTYRDMPKITPEQKARLSELQRGNFERLSPEEFEQRNGTGSYQELLRLQNARDGFDVDRLRVDASISMREARKYQSIGNQNGAALAQKYVDRARVLNDRADLLEAETTSNPPKYRSYSLPGGENYREVVITLPPAVDTSGYKITGSGNSWFLRDADNNVLEAFGSKDQAESTMQRRAASKQPDAYRSSHWDEINPLAHLRMSDRVTDGKKTLLVDEVQSDWHQQGREKGYAKQIDMPSMSADDILSKYRTELSSEQKNWLNNYIKHWEEAELDNNTNLMDKMTSHLAEWVSKQKIQSGVPDAPFKEDWYQLALKRAIKEAIDGGYDRVALPTGALVADRFDLSKKITGVSYQKMKDGQYSVRVQPKGEGEYVNVGTFKADMLPDVVGKEMTQKIIAGEGERAGSTGIRTFSGLDLRVGGEGMKKYYDEVYPGYLKKFGKKYGASVGKTTVDADGVAEPLHYMEITPAMREAFKTGIHMKRGGKVSFANDIDAMRLELSKG